MVIPEVMDAVEVAFKAVVAEAVDEEVGLGSADRVSSGECSMLSYRDR